VFAARRLQEMARGLDMDLYWVFVDLTKAYDSVHRETLWKVLAKCGIPQHLIDIIEDWHTGMQACVKMNGERTRKFNIDIGLRQGDVMAPTLFNIFFSMVLQVMEKKLKSKMEEMSKQHIGIPIKFDTTIQSWMFKWVNGENRINENIKFDDLWNLLFADDAAFMSTSEEGLQLLISIFNEISDGFGLTISIQKTEVLCQKKMFKQVQESAQTKYNEAKKRKKPLKSNISINQQILSDVFDFKYLGSIFNQGGTIDTELKRRIILAQATFNNNRKIFNSKYMLVDTKMKYYNMLVVPQLLWDCNNWMLNKTQYELFEKFHNDCLRVILRKTWKDKITIEELHKRTGSGRMELRIKMRRLRMLSKIERMSDDMITKVMMYGAIDVERVESFKNKSKLSSEKKKERKQNLFMIQTREVLKEFGINEAEWRKLATKPELWKKMLKEKEIELNKKWRLNQIKMRKERKEKEKEA
jgi:hypothetical protein